MKITSYRTDGQTPAPRLAGLPPVVARTAPRDLEHPIQAAFILRVDTDPRTCGLLIYAVPNFAGFHGSKGARMRSGARAKAEGRRPAAPDINVDEPSGSYHGLRIEFKAPGNYPTPDQRLWHARLREKGYQALVCRSADEGWAALCDYLGIPCAP